VIVIDTPVRTRVRGKEIWTAHLVSDAFGVTGSRELLEAAKQLQLRREWLRDADTAFERFTLVGEERIALARALRIPEVSAAVVLRICTDKFLRTLEQAVSA